MTEVIPTVPVYVSKQNKQPHCRIAIRRWVKALMKANVDINVKNWFLSRPDPVFDREAPIGFIYMNDEPADHQGTAPRNYLRSTQIVIQIARRMNSETPEAMDDWLDSRAYEIEKAMLTDRFLGQRNFIQDTILTSTQPTKIHLGDADSDHASIGLFFTIEWRDGFSINETKLDEFFTYLNTIEGTEGENAQDDVTIRTK